MSLCSVHGVLHVFWSGFSTWGVGHVDACDCVVVPPSHMPQLPCPVYSLCLDCSGLFALSNKATMNILVRVCS